MFICIYYILISFSWFAFLSLSLSLSFFLPIKEREKRRPVSNLAGNIGARHFFSRARPSNSISRRIEKFNPLPTTLPYFPLFTPALSPSINQNYINFNRPLSLDSIQECCSTEAVRVRPHRRNIREFFFLKSHRMKVEHSIFIGEDMERRRWMKTRRRRRGMNGSFNSDVGTFPPDWRHYGSELR